MLDALAGCSIVAFDKTGTLTTGSLSCTSMRPLGATPAGTSTAGSSFDASSSSSSRRAGSAASVLGVPPREAAAAKRSALAAAVALSLRSSHPVSDAVVLHGAAAGLDGSGEEVADFQLVAGGGVEGVVSAAGGGKRGGADGGAQHAALGSLEYVSGRLSREEVAAVEAAAAAQGTSSVLSVLVLTPTGEATSGGDAGSSGGGGSGRSVWVMAFEDSVRQQSASAVRALQTVRRRAEPSSPGHRSSSRCHSTPTLATSHHHPTTRSLNPSPGPSMYLHPGNPPLFRQGTCIGDSGGGWRCMLPGLAAARPGGSASAVAWHHACRL